MFKKKLKNILWIFPFISFVFGYYFLHTLLQKKEIFTPNVIGQNIQSAMKGMSKCGLNIRLLREQEDSDLPAGIVLEQIPKPNQMVRPNQHVFVTISKRPQTVLAPDFLGQRYKFIVKQVAKLGIHAKVFWLQSTYPKNFCIAQSPQPEQEMRDQKLIIYVSSGSDNLYIFPNLKEIPVLEVSKLFEKEGIKVEVFHNKKVNKNHKCSNCKITDQKPMYGSIVDLSKTLYVQLQVEEFINK